MRRCSTWKFVVRQRSRAAHTHWIDGAQEMRDAVGVLRAIAEGAHCNYSGAVHVNTGNWIQRPMPRPTCGRD
jgi:hypothetical protein